MSKNNGTDYIDPAESVNAGWTFGYLCECDDCVMCDGCADFIRSGEDPQPYLDAARCGATGRTRG